MTTPPERYTAEQMLRMSECVEDFYIPLGARLKNQHDTLYAMLRQAASDVRDAERFRYVRDNTTALEDYYGLENGEMDLGELLDTAMGERDE